MVIPKLVNKGGFTPENSRKKFGIGHAKLKNLFKVALDNGYFQKNKLNPSSKFLRNFSLEN